MILYRYRQFKQGLRVLGILALGAAFAACDAENTDTRIRIGGNSPKGFYAGAAAEKVTPELVDTYFDLDFAGDATGSISHHGPDGVFNGTDFDAIGDSSKGIEGFDDGNGDGKFTPVWLAGSSNRRPANHVHDELWARAVAVRSGEVSIIFVTIDAVGYFNDEVRAIRQEVSKQVIVGQLVVSASHSHETPDTIGLWGPDEGAPGWTPEYRSRLREKAVKAAVDAARAAVPIEMAVNSGPVISPRSSLKPGNMHYDARDPVAIDDTLSVMQFRGINRGPVVATLVNWAGHPEHMIDGNDISADYVFYLREKLEKRYPGSLGLFVNGALGGQIGTNHADVLRAGRLFSNQADKACREERHTYVIARIKAEGRCPAGFEQGDREWMWDKAEAVGLNVADRAIELLGDASVEKAPRIVVRSRDVYLPIDNKGYRLVFLLGALQDRALFTDSLGKHQAEIKDYNINRRWYVRTDVQRIAFQTANKSVLEILTVPGELHPEIAVGGWDGSKTGGLQPFVDPNNENPPFPRLPDSVCDAPPCWDDSKAPKGPFLRERMKANHTMIFGLTEDELGYIVPAYNWELDAENPYLDEAKGDHYEETNSLGPETANRLLKVYDELLAE